MHVRDVFNEGIRYLLVEEVELDSFDPSRGTEPVEVGLVNDEFRLRVMPIIAKIADESEKERVSRTRSVIRDLRSEFDGVVRLFAPIPADAIIARAKSGHLLVPLDAEGNPRGRARKIVWLGSMMVAPL